MVGLNMPTFGVYAATKAAMALFVFLTPGAIYLRAKITILESGTDLVSSQSERLRTSDEIIEMTQCT